ncbi:MAG: class I SAM-dependent methyltransferase [Phototrophicaceae bacterium]
MSDILEQQQAYYRARSAEYDQWWERQGRYDQGTERNQQWQIEGQIVRDTLHQLPAQNHILELACGTGIWTKELVKLGQSITAVDASAEMLAINQAKVQSDRVTYIQADLFTWQSEQQFDMIFFGFWLSHVPSDKLQAFLQGVSQMLKPNGYLFIIDSQRNQTATAKNQNMLDESPIHTRILNDGREFQIIKVFYDRDELQSELAQVNIDADVRLTNEFFIYAHGQKVIRS